jgi:quercetin dioxygenase-like cupin family protein
MRSLITGVDDHGRSCVVEEADVTFDHTTGSPIAHTVVCATTACPPPPRPPGHAMDVDMGLPVGIVRWLALEFAAGGGAPLHHTDSVDFVFVFEGSVELILDDGVHPLGPGDFVALNGVDHAWQAGPEGCRASSVVTGTPPPG